MGWWYVFGSASMTLLAVQILTGIGLALVYVPSADKAYVSLLYLNDAEPLGWFLRSLHYYAGSGMVVLVLAHMTQVFLHGAYKYPREMTWVLGVCLLLCTLGMFFTGQVLRWDPDAYWGLAVGASMAGRVPVLGPWLVHLLLGGPVIGGDSLSRFFALHVFVIPGLLVFALVVHLWLVVKCGISEVPRPGAAVDPRTYDAALSRSAADKGRSISRRCRAQGRVCVGSRGDRCRCPRRHFGSQGAERSSRSDACGRQPAAGMAVPLVIRIARAESTVGGDVHYARLSAHSDSGFVPCPLCE